MRSQSVFLILALVALALLWSPSAIASIPTSADSVVEAPAVQEAVPAPAPAPFLSFDDPTLFPTTVVADKSCSNSYCDYLCRLQGYDYGVCFIDQCVCRFWHP